MADPLPPDATPPPAPPPPELFGTVVCALCNCTMDAHGSKDCYGHTIEGLKALPIVEALAKL